jgi:hypothetical protein
MTMRYIGGCACGAVRFEANAEPIAEVHCQCSHCQKRSGTGHSSYIVFPQRAGVATKGEAKTWRIKGDSGNEKIHAFCPTCGTPVFLTFAANDMIAIHVASLDEPAQFKPQFVTYASRGHAWDTIEPSLKKFDKGPG